MGNREVCLEYCTGIRSNRLLQLRGIMQCIVVNELLRKSVVYKVSEGTTLSSLVSADSLENTYQNIFCGVQ